jgi:transposase
LARAQVLVGPERRRRWSDEQKRAVVAAAFAPGAVVSEVARQADVCASLIYRWRRELMASHGFSEVIVADRGDGEDPPQTEAAAIEVTVEGRIGVRIPASTPPELAAAVTAALVRR